MFIHVIQPYTTYAVVALSLNNLKSTNQPTNNQYIDRSIDRSINQSINQSIIVTGCFPTYAQFNHTNHTPGLFPHMSYAQYISPLLTHSH